MAKEGSMGEANDTSVRELLLPYRHLALRVLVRALLDVANPNGSMPDRQSARAFLNGSGMLLHWCRVAELDPAAIAAVAERLAEGPPMHVRSRRSPWEAPPARPTALTPAFH
jgi:hypothetical protein